MRGMDGAPGGRMRGSSGSEKEPSIDAQHSAFDCAFDGKGY